MKNIWFISAILCLAYNVLLHLSAGLVVDFSWIWLAAGAGFAAIGLLNRVRKGWFGALAFPVRGLIVLAAAALIAVFVYLLGCVFSGMRQKEQPGLPFVIVLGAHVNGELPSRSLKYRLDKAAEYAKNNPETILILSGGQGFGEDITEAECMRRYLIGQGIEPARLIKEERSTTTRENLRFSNELTGFLNGKLGIVSNDFHIYRALRLAAGEGAKEAYGIPAPAGAMMKPHFIVRETAALVKMWLQDIL